MSKLGHGGPHILLSHFVRLNFLFSDVLKTFEAETTMPRPMLLKRQTVHSLAAKTLRCLESLACIVVFGFNISKRTIPKDMSLMTQVLLKTCLSRTNLMCCAAALIQRR